MDELTRASAAFCPVARTLRFQIIGKRPELDAYRVACPG